MSCVSVTMMDQYYYTYAGLKDLSFILASNRCHSLHAAI